MALRDARLALASMLETATKATVIPNPPRQLGTAKTVSFVAIRKARADQSGGDQATVTILATASSQTDFSWDDLDEFTDTIDAALDANCDLGDGISATADGEGEWVMGLHEVAGVAYFGAVLDVALWF